MKGFRFGGEALRRVIRIALRVPVDKNRWQHRLSPRMGCWSPLMST